jgi:hypothetical protein
LISSHLIYSKRLGDSKKMIKVLWPCVLSFACFLGILSAAAKDSATQPARGLTGITVAIESAEEGQRRVTLYSGYHALVVGCGAYRKGWPPLPNPVEDAREVAAALEAMGWSVDLVEDKESRPKRGRTRDFLPGGNCQPRGRKGSTEHFKDPDSVPRAPIKDQGSFRAGSGKQSLENRGLRLRACRPVQSLNRGNEHGVKLRSEIG